MKSRDAYRTWKAHSARLRRAREMAGYRMASDAARDLGVSIATYLSHENGTRGLGRTAIQYAQFFNVDLGWLLTGHGHEETKGSHLSG
jgi:transcriptional regulator with XRE-family HTH domain